MTKRLNENIGKGQITTTEAASEMIQQTKTPATGHSSTGGADARGEVRIWSYG